MFIWNGTPFTEDPQINIHIHLNKKSKEKIVKKELGKIIVSAIKILNTLS